MCQKIVLLILFNSTNVYSSIYIDLGELAMRLDEEERVQMTESENGIES